VLQVARFLAFSCAVESLDAPSRLSPRPAIRYVSAMPARQGPVELARMREAELLDLRLCDLDLKLKDTPLAARALELRIELQKRKLRFRPGIWLSSDWFSPHGVTGFAVPFYLAHPRLARLERKQMLAVEGGGRRQSMQLFRHECGHAIDTAFRLHRRQDWRAVFGRFSERYSPHYQAAPKSRDFVQHLDAWYAQSHPAEDFAETFAVWLDPRSRWRERYAGWPALRKLEYVDKLMGRLAGVNPPVVLRERTEELRTLKLSLREHYAQKRAQYSSSRPEVQDGDLLRLFHYNPKNRRASSAARYMAKIRPAVRERVALWTGEAAYTIDQVLADMILRARELRLSLEPRRKDLARDVELLVAVQTMNYLHSGFHRRTR
jgi:hypothetical protein